MHNKYNKNGFPYLVTLIAIVILSFFKSSIVSFIFCNYEFISFIVSFIALGGPISCLVLYLKSNKKRAKR